ncbi:MAG TPA: hypothetical protein VG935_03280, partial [Patescibacteria group bacterium]|nr:hypothetical protein [Patescibacteria group bacterium]
MKDKMSNLYCPNPYISIYINNTPHSNFPFFIYNPESKERFEVNGSILEVIYNSYQPRSLSSIELSIKEKTQSDRSTSKELLKILIKRQILISRSEYDNKIRSLQLFTKYNWLNGFYFLIDEENPVVADKNSN